MFTGLADTFKSLQVYFYTTMKLIKSYSCLGGEKNL